MSLDVLYLSRTEVIHPGSFNQNNMAIINAARIDCEKPLGKHMTQHSSRDWIKKRQKSNCY